MVINQKTLERLRNLINEEIEYRTGPQLVAFFNELGFNDSYGEEFPARWRYTEERLKKINGTPELDKCMREVFSPINFVGKLEQLDTLILEFNKYLMFDNWQIVRNIKDITFKKVDDKEWERVCESNANIEIPDEKKFMELDIKYDINKLKLSEELKEVLKERIIEIEKCINYEIPLSAILLSGSTLEGILLGYALLLPKEFNTVSCSPKTKEGKVKNFNEWALNDLINASTEIGLLKIDISKFSHSLRDFRNYIHPYQQLVSAFSPNINTAKICCQVLKSAIAQLVEYKVIGG